MARVSTGFCTGYGVANTIYGLAPYNSATFAQALGSIECAASTTPYAAAVDSATGMLVEETGPIAVFIVSDFNYNWNDPAAVESALAELKAQHPGKVCVHIIKIGEDARQYRRPHRYRRLRQRCERRRPGAPVPRCLPTSSIPC